MRGYSCVGRMFIPVFEATINILIRIRLIFMGCEMDAQLLQRSFTISVGFSIHAHHCYFSLRELVWKVSLIYVGICTHYH